MNVKLPLIKIRGLVKKYQIKEKIKENLRKYNDYWNDRKLQFHWKKLEWVGLKTRDRKNNPFCSSTHKFYIKDGNKSCNVLDIVN